MAGHGKKDIDHVLLEVLASGGSITLAAERAKVHESTVRRRMSDQTFRDQVSALRSQRITDAIGRLSTIAVAAVDELYRLFRESPNDQVRLSAARAALTLALQGLEHELLVKQVQEQGEALVALKAEMERVHRERRNVTPPTRPSANRDRVAADGDPEPGTACADSLAV
jgi:hypothetical protein